MESPFTAYQGSDPYIFVSYSHKDAGAVFTELSWLRDQGFNIWYDEGIKPGSEWRSELADAIQGCHLFLYFVTSNSVESEHCVRETNFALEQNRTILAVHLEETAVPSSLSFSLGGTQAVLRYELTELDYRLKLLKGVGDSIQRGIAAASSGVKTSNVPHATVYLGALATIAATLILAWVIFGRAQIEPTVSNVEMTLQISEINKPSGLKDDASVLQPLELTRDGKSIVYAAKKDGRLQLFSRRLDELDTFPIANTEANPDGVFGPGSFSLSPDGKWVAFIDTSDGTKIKKVRLNGGRVTTLCEVRRGWFHGMAWGSNGWIVFKFEENLGLMRVSENGGVPVAITEQDATKDDRHIHPFFLPDGKHLLYSKSQGLDRQRTNLVVIRSLEDGKEKVLTTGTSPQVAASGHLLFSREDDVWAAPFDLKTLEITGEEVPILQGVQVVNRAHYSMSDTGLLVYSTTTKNINRSLAWLDRNGNEELVGVEPRAYSMPRVSPDGKNIAVVVEPKSGSRDIFLINQANGLAEQFTFDDLQEAMPEWNADGDKISYAVYAPLDARGIYSKSTAGSGTNRLTSTDTLQLTSNWSKDGDIFYEDCPVAVDHCNITMLKQGSGPSTIVFESPANDRYAAISPDGKWMVYQSDETGEQEIYLRPYPNVNDGRWRISPDGGQQPSWSRLGDEVFYWGRTHLMTVPLEFSPEPKIEVAKQLFNLNGYEYTYARNYGVSPDAAKFLMVKLSTADSNSRTVLVQNWFHELDKVASE
jgi:Tol biopolymer transport system component